MNEEKSESRRAVKLPPYPGLEKVHRANLRLLKEIDRICRKYKISYMLDSGTLLGAVRHEGFIPWDDDVDLAFTRAIMRCFEGSAAGAAGGNVPAASGGDPGRQGVL